MLKTFIAIVIIVGVSLILLAVKLFFGQKFVHTDIAGNKALNDRGINCVIDEEKKILENQKKNINK